MSDRSYPTVKKPIKLTLGQSNDLLWFLWSRDYDIENEIENFGGLKSLLPLLKINNSPTTNIGDQDDS